MPRTKRIQWSLAATGFAIAALWLVPAIMSLYEALTENRMLGPTDIVRVFTWSNFAQALQVSGLWRYFLNSLIVTFSAVVLVSLFASLSAFAISRLKFRGRMWVYAAMLMTLMIPQTALAIPIFFINQAFHLFNNYFGLIMPYTALGIPFSMVILKGFFDQFPREVEEAALIDGAGALRIFAQILFPNSLSSVSIVVIWTFMQSWNEFLFAMLFMTDNSMKTLALAPIVFQNAYQSHEGALMAFLVLNSLPIIVAYLALQQYFERGLTSGAIKG